MVGAQIDRYGLIEGRRPYNVTARKLLFRIASQSGVLTNEVGCLRAEGL
jgi:hypothetical protein